MDMRYIGSLCRAARERKNTTQLDVALDLGYTQDNVSRFEHGKNRSLIMLLFYLKNFFSDQEIIDFVRGVKHDA